MSNNDLSRAEIGDSLYSVVWGWGVVTEIDLSDRTLKVFFEDFSCNYWFNWDGTRLTEHLIGPTLFWDVPHYSFPVCPKPKKVKKVVEQQVVVNSEGKVVVFIDCLTDKSALRPCLGDQIITLTGECEVDA